MTEWGASSTPLSFLRRFTWWQISIVIFLGLAVLTGALLLAVTVSAGSLFSVPLEKTPTSTLIPTRAIFSATLTPLSPIEDILTGAPLDPTPSAPATETSSPAAPLSLPTLSTLPATSTEVCGAPPGWVTYRIQPGDTLFSISAASGTTIEELQQANCLTSTNIITGQMLYVPKLPEIPTPTNPAAESPTIALPLETPVPSLTPSSINPTPLQTEPPGTPMPSSTTAPIETEAVNPTQNPTETAAPGG